MSMGGKIVAGACVVGVAALGLEATGTFEKIDQKLESMGWAPDYDGSGDEFAVTGQITDVGERSIKIDTAQVDRADGDAEGWFNQGNETQIHDNFEGDECELEQVGAEYDITGAEVELGNLSVGQWVSVEGNIRDSAECGVVIQGNAQIYGAADWEGRAVYTSVQVVPTPEK